MEFDEALSEISYKLGLPFEWQWKDRQLQCLQAIYERKDVLAVLPTSYGKSVLFQSTPFLLACKDGVHVDATDNIILIITPLNSIMEDQCLDLCKRDLNACFLIYNAQGNILFSCFYCTCA